MGVKWGQYLSKKRIQKKIKNKNNNNNNREKRDT